MHQLFRLVSVTLAILAVEATDPGKTQICRFVCPDTVGGSPLINELLEPNGAALLCEWNGNGLGFRAASFDSVCPSTTSHIHHIKHQQLIPNFNFTYL